MIDKRNKGLEEKAAKEERRYQINAELWEFSLPHKLLVISLPPEVWDEGLGDDLYCMPFSPMTWELGQGVLYSCNVGMLFNWLILLRERQTLHSLLCINSLRRHKDYLNIIIVNKITT